MRPSAHDLVRSAQGAGFGLKSTARRALPGIAAERAIRYEAALREARGVQRVAVTARRRLGDVVVSGPFVGMRLAPGFERHAASPVLKLVGLYEPQLHAALERAISVRPQVVANIGCADGYYATGLAIRLPDAVVHAYDLAKSARVQTAELAGVNAVAERVVVHKRCRRFPAGIDLVICDIEGGEDSLLTPARLTTATVIVETHDHVHSGLTERLGARFAPTHTVEVLDATHSAQPASLNWMSRTDLDVALDEMRGHADQSWLVLVPRRL